MEKHFNKYRINIKDNIFCERSYLKGTKLKKALQSPQISQKLQTKTVKLRKKKPNKYRKDNKNKRETTYSTVNSKIL